MGKYFTDSPIHRLPHAEFSQKAMSLDLVPLTLMLHPVCPIHSVNSLLRRDRLQAILEILHPTQLAFREDLAPGFEIVSAFKQQCSDNHLVGHGVLVVVDVRGACRAEEASHVLACVVLKSSASIPHLTVRSHPEQLCRRIGPQNLPLAP